MRWLVVLVVLSATRVAHASWWYTWTCTGNCSSGQLAATGVRGPYSSEGDCDGARGSDPVNELIMESGNLGSISYCSESDSPPAVDGGGGWHRHVPTQRLSLAIVGGPGWHLRDTDTMTEQTGDFTAGGDARVLIGGRPFFALVLGAGGQATRITTPKAGTGQQSMLFASLVFGVQFAPRLSEHLRLEFGGDLVGNVGVLCSACQSAGWEDVHGGFDIYGSGRRGVEIDVTYQSYSSDPNVMLPPDWLVRVSLLRRNVELAW